MVFEVVTGGGGAETSGVEVGGTGFVVGLVITLVMYEVVDVVTGLELSVYVVDGKVFRLLTKSSYIQLYT